MTGLPSLSRLSPRAQRLVPLAGATLVLLLGLSYFVWPLVRTAVADTRELEVLEGRRDALSREAAGRPGGASAALRDPVAEFERAVPQQDRASEVMEAVARIAVEPADPSRARALRIQAGAVPLADAAESPSKPGGRPTLDPRWALFPGTVEPTPITVTYETTYERVGNFLWRLRGLPTLVEIRSVEMTRALPLLKVNITLFALRRSNRLPATPAPAAPPTQPVPRVADDAVRGDEAPPWR